jgi:pseudouridine-5'-phosphate glycosidase
VVCSGAKSILDLAATWERLESLGVPVVGYRVNELPGFYAAQTGIALTARVDEARQVVEIFRAHRALGRLQALLVVQPAPAEYALERKVVDEAVSRAREDAARRGIRGAAVTPFLLAAIGESTGGASLETNLALLERNAGLAGEIAQAAADR